MKKTIQFNDINYAMIDIEEIKNYIEIYKELFVHNINDNGLYPILQATLMARIDIMQLLIKKGARTDVLTKYGDDMLSIAVESGDAETIKFVLNLGFKVGDSVMEYTKLKNETYLIQSSLTKNYLDYAKEILSNKDIIELLEERLISENLSIKKDSFSIRFKKLFQQKGPR